MVFLRDELVLENELIRRVSGKLRQLASLEFAVIFHKHRNRLDSTRFFGDEIEYIIVNLDHQHKLPQLLPIYPHIQSLIQQYNTNSSTTRNHAPDSTVLNTPGNTDTNTLVNDTVDNTPYSTEDGADVDWEKCIFTPEYASYMVESIPDKPYELESNYINTIRASINERRRRLSVILRLLGFPNAKVTTLTNFLRLGCEDCVYLGDEKFRQPLTGELEYKLSDFFPNICITPFSRFTEITHNIKLKHPTNIRIPKFNNTRVVNHKNTTTRGINVKIADRWDLELFGLLSEKQRKLAYELSNNSANLFTQHTHQSEKSSVNFTNLELIKKVNLSTDTENLNDTISNSSTSTSDTNTNSTPNTLHTLTTDEMRVYNCITEQVFMYDPQLHTQTYNPNFNTFNTFNTTFNSTFNTTFNSTVNSIVNSSDTTSVNTPVNSTNPIINNNISVDSVGNVDGTEVGGVESGVCAVRPNTVTEIHMDTVGFGMGMACLQVTFGCVDISEARYLHDQLIPLTPIFLSLSSATVAFRGELSNIDNRWPVLVQAMDDLDDQDRGYILKGRYNTTSLYIQNCPLLMQNYEYLNDIQVASDATAYVNLVKLGVDPILSRYISHNLVYQPLVVYQEDLDQVDCTTTDMHYQVFHATNWNSIRFNHPKPAHTILTSNSPNNPVHTGNTSNNPVHTGNTSNNPVHTGNSSNNIGVSVDEELPWRIEFRPMDIQMTDEENVMFISVLSYVVRVLLRLRLSLYMPISLVDSNTDLACTIESCHKQLFHFPNHIHNSDVVNLEEVGVGRYSLHEILFGKIGLFRIVLDYLEFEYSKSEVSPEFYSQIKVYFNHFELLTLGKTPTNATKQRRFIHAHPSYQHDGIIHNDILYDLINHLTCQ